MNTERPSAVIFGIFLLISHALSGETTRHGAAVGWGGTVAQGLKETRDQKGDGVLSLDTAASSDLHTGNLMSRNIDLLLLPGPEGMGAPMGSYRIEGDYEILHFAPGETAIRPGLMGLKIYPTAGSLWSAGMEWDDFTLVFDLRPKNLRDGETFFSWKGQNQSVTARVEKRRLVWHFDGLFRHGSQRSLNLTLASPPLIPGEWRHHRLRFKGDTGNPESSGASPGLLEYLVDGVPVAMVHATPDGREGAESFVPRILGDKNEPLHLAPSLLGDIGSFLMASAYSIPVPVNQESAPAAWGRGRTTPMETGHSESSFVSVRAQARMPGASRIRFFVRSVEDLERPIGLPDPTDPAWVELETMGGADDAADSTLRYSWTVEGLAREQFLVVGYIFASDPRTDLSPSLLSLEVEMEAPSIKAEDEGGEAEVRVPRISMGKDQDDPLFSPTWTGSRPEGTGGRETAPAVNTRPREARPLP